MRKCWSSSLRHHELVQLLPDGRVVQLVGLDHAVDRSEDVPLKKVFNQHCNSHLWNELEGPVVVFLSLGFSSDGFKGAGQTELAEQPKRHLVVLARVEHDQGRLAHDLVQVVQ